MLTDEELRGQFCTIVPGTNQQGMVLKPGPGLGATLNFLQHGCIVVKFGSMYIVIIVITIQNTKPSRQYPLS